MKKCLHGPHFSNVFFCLVLKFSGRLSLLGTAGKDAVSAEVGLALCLRVRSVAATCLHHHAFVMPHHHLPVLVVEHGQRSQACRYTGRTRDAVGLVQL